MYKNLVANTGLGSSYHGFNPCFNGTMYKNLIYSDINVQQAYVSILVLMDLCIKTFFSIRILSDYFTGFNPCFNGSMYKNTLEFVIEGITELGFNPCFNGSMYKNDF